MKKNMLIFGGKRFINEIYDENGYKVSKKKNIISLKKNYEIDNFSKNDLNFDEIKSAIEVFSSVRNYDLCVIDLSENSIKNKKSVKDYYNSLKHIIEILYSKSIKVILVGLQNKVLKKYNAKDYELVLKKLKEEYKTKYITEYEVNDNDSYIAKNDFMLKKAIINLGK